MRDGLNCSSVSRSLDPLLALVDSRRRLAAVSACLSVVSAHRASFVDRRMWFCYSVPAYRVSICDLFMSSQESVAQCWLQWDVTSVKRCVQERHIVVPPEPAVLRLYLHHDSHIYTRHHRLWRPSLVLGMRGSQTTHLCCCRGRCLWIICGIALP